MSDRVPTAERLLDLVIALSHTRHPMTKGEIRSQVNGYASASSAESFDRMFERDKDQLRQLGIPIVTLTDAAYEDVVGYRIDMEQYALPPVNFTPAEVGVLSLAAQVWQDSSFASDSRRGLTKLRAVSEPSDPGEHVGLALRVRGPDPSFGPLLEAITDRVTVTFTYRAASTGQMQERVVQPWRLVAKDRGWYLIGYDTARADQRSFRLSRIMSAVIRVGTPGEVDVPADVTPGPVTTTVVTLALTPERASAIRSRSNSTSHPAAPPDRDVVELNVTDIHQFAEQIVGYGENILVLEPPELRRTVVEKFQAAHGWGRS